MTTDVLHEQWALDLAVRIEVIGHRKSIACATEARSPDRAAAAAAVDHFLDEAKAAVRRTSRWFPGRSPLDHWRGVSVVRAYENVHAAETFLIDLLDESQIRVLLPSVTARAHAALRPDDPRLQDVDGLSEAVRDGDVCRDRFKQAMLVSFQAEDQIYLRIRALRNLVVKCTVLLFVLMSVLIGMVAWQPEALPLCFTPGAVGPDPAPTICPSGDHQPPSSPDIVIVAGLGLLGSAVAAAFAIRRIQGVPTPYDIAVALGFFKLPLGMLTAVAGLLVLGGNFVPGLSELDNQRQILAYALVFGYGQQLVSRFIDARAQDIVKKLPLTQLTPATE
jgi:hypothetical protein